MNRFSKKSKLPLIFIVLGLVLVLALIVVPKLLPGSTPPDASGFQTYQNKKFGFSVKHPLGWSVDDTKFAETQEVIVFEDTEDAFVKINAYQDSSISSEATVRKASQLFIQEMGNDPNVTVTNSTADFKDKTGGHIITGQQIIDGQNYQFQNRALISTNGRLLIFQAVVKKDLDSQEYQDILNAIIDSFAVN